MNQQEAVEEAKKRGLKWVAMDADGTWCGYYHKPKITHRQWSEDGGCFIFRCGPNWRDSLTEVK